MDKTIIELVKKEAENLRKYTTEEERELLNISHLDADSTKLCVYGQMTGNCYSSRAHDLITLCCEKVYTVPSEKMRDGTDIYSKANLNGAPSFSDIKFSGRKSYWFSPIETFITMPHNQYTRNNEILIDYIKGTTDTLEFELPK